MIGSVRAVLTSVFTVAMIAGSSSVPMLSADEVGPSRPFSGSAEGMIAGLLPPNELVIEYTGTATHLGKFTREEHLFQNPDGSFSGEIVFTAANGDELWLDFEGAFISPTTAEGTYTITGGTGRFSDATGEATFTAYTPDGVHVSATFDGTIRY